MSRQTVRKQNVACEKCRATKNIREGQIVCGESECVVDDDMPQNSHVETKQLVVKSDREAVAQDGMLQKFYTVHKNRAVKTGSNAVVQDTVQQYHTVVKNLVGKRLTFCRKSDVVKIQNITACQTMRK